jgi:hypothetical protein
MYLYSTVGFNHQTYMWTCICWRTIRVNCRNESYTDTCPHIRLMITSNSVIQIHVHIYVWWLHPIGGFVFISLHSVPCDQCYPCLWIAHSWLPVQFSLKFIWLIFTILNTNIIVEHLRISPVSEISKWHSAMHAYNNTNEKTDRQRNTLYMIIRNILPFLVIFW